MQYCLTRQQAGNTEVKLLLNYLWAGINRKRKKKKNSQ